jgi:uncharacterized membrane protein YhaH (DUF805 family)
MSFLFSFSGRIGRLHWWMLNLLFSFLPFALLFAYVYFSGEDIENFIFRFIDRSSLTLLSLVLCWILIAADVKRYHDRGKSGFWIFIIFIPIIGWFWKLIELGFIPGDDADNEYGSPTDDLGWLRTAENTPTVAPSRAARAAAERVDTVNIKPQNTIASKSAPRFGKRL